MTSYEASTTIMASPEAVWQVLSDAARWPTWDSGVTAVEGSLAPGSRLTIRAAVAAGRAFPVTVTAFEPAARLELTGGMPLGLFRGVRTYTLTQDDTLTPGGTASTTFHVREDYTGLLRPLIARSIPDLGPSFRQFAEGLKRQVESSVTP